MLTRANGFELRKEVMALFGIAVLLLLCIGLFLYQASVEKDKSEAWVIHTYEVIEASENFFSSLKDAETGQRGYLLTQQKKYLDPYLAARTDVFRHMGTLKRLTQDSPHQAARLEGIDTNMQKRMKALEEVIHLQNTQGRPAAVQFILNGAGKSAMEAIRQDIEQFVQQEHILLKARNKASAEASNHTRLVFSLGFAFVFFLLGSSFYLVNREMHERKLAEQQLHNLNIALENQVSVLNQEISERKKAEATVAELNQELEKQLALLNESNDHLNAVNQELESFAYSVSHDLRAPLRGIDGFSQAVLEDYGDLLDQNGKEFLQRIRKESQRMGQLIDGLLSLSRLTRGNIMKEPVSLSEMAHTILGNLQSEEPERKVNFQVQDSIVVDGDPRLMEAVLQNLLSNAWKFTAKHPTAHIEFGSMQSHEKTIYYVKDDGAGFDMTYVDKLFGAFQRLHGMTEFAGTGIGLATVQRIIHRHGGTIWAEGAIEKGATFYFTLS